MKKIKVSVIIPIYKVEKYIERCVRSLFSQTLDELEFIFINDCTPDNSINILHSILELFPERKKQTTIINMSNNSGQAAVRKIGMQTARGKYMIHCDADDWIEPCMYEKLYLEAEKNNSDIVICDFYNEFSDHTSVYRYTGEKNPLKEINETKRTQWWVLWNRLIKTELITKNNIYPIEGQNFLEDVCIMMRAYYYANKISYVKDALYHYNRENQNSTMKSTYSTNMIKQQKANIDYIASFFSEHNFDFNNTYNIYKEAIRNRYLCQEITNWAEWEKTYPEIGNIIYQDKRFPYLYRALYKLASNGFLLPFKLYHEFSKIKNS